MHRHTIGLAAAVVVWAVAGLAGDAARPPEPVAVVPAGGQPCPQAVADWVRAHGVSPVFECAMVVRSEPAGAGDGALLLEPAEAGNWPRGLHPYLVLADGVARLRLVIAMRGDRGAVLIKDKRGHFQVSLDLEALEAGRRARITEGAESTWVADIAADQVGTDTLRLLTDLVDKPVLKSGGDKVKLGSGFETLERFLDLLEVLPQAPTRFPDSSHYDAYLEGVKAASAEDHEAATAHWLSAAREGHWLSQHALAMYHLEGAGGQPDVEEGLRWLRRAAETGYAKSQYHLGYMYVKGDHVEQDAVEALRLFILGARTYDHGDSRTAAEGLRSRLTADEVARAEVAADAWNPCPADFRGEPLTKPRRLVGSQPVYPELPRMARQEAQVILASTILTDGSVADVRVVHVDKPGMGFEVAAALALRLWRYEPATRCGKPIDLVFSVVVDFELI